MSTAIYAGPGKVYFNSKAFQADGENGPVDILLNNPTAEIATAMFGKMGEQDVDQTLDITFKPFDNWGSLGTLFPARVGAKVGATAAALGIGTRPHASGVGQTAQVWTPDGRSYTAVRAAVIGHPSLHLGVGKALFGNAKLVGLWNDLVAMGTAPGTNFLTIVESAASDPGGAMVMTDFVREAWTGVWGTVAGFGGADGSDGNENPIQSEDEWTIECAVKYSPLKNQGRTIWMKLDSCAYMAKCKPYGPTHTDLLAAVGANTQGQRLGSADLVLTSGISSKTITLQNAAVRGAGFKFGGTTIGTGELGFVNFMGFNTNTVPSGTAGKPDALIIFSA